MIEIILLIIIGIFAGIFSGLFGIGGGVIIVLGLTLMGLSQHKAQGISLGAFLIPIGVLMSFYEYYRNGNADIKASIIIAFGLVIGSYIGAFIANKLSSIWLSRLFGIFLFLMAIRMIFKN
ncbi:MAG: sulfite exporter TauE/SafE family protein [candidate division WOR-3 bacterium]